MSVTRNDRSRAPSGQLPLPGRHPTLRLPAGVSLPPRPVSRLPPQPLPRPPAPGQQQHLGPTQPFAQELSYHLLDDEGAHEGVLVCTEEERSFKWGPGRRTRPPTRRLQGEGLQLGVQRVFREGRDQGLGWTGERRVEARCCPGGSRTPRREDTPGPGTSQAGMPQGSGQAWMSQAGVGGQGQALRDTLARVRGSCKAERLRRPRCSAPTPVAERGWGEGRGLTFLRLGRSPTPDVTGAVGDEAVTQGWCEPATLLCRPRFPGRTTLPGGTPEERAPLGRTSAGKTLQGQDPPGRTPSGRPRTRLPGKDLLAPSYTMLAFHQCGFSSGWEDRIPVPAAGGQRQWWQGACEMRTRGRLGGEGILVGPSKVGGDTCPNQSCLGSRERMGLVTDERGCPARPGQLDMALHRPPSTRCADPGASRGLRSCGKPRAITCGTRER